jgi:hypothetical protein
MRSTSSFRRQQAVRAVPAVRAGAAHAVWQRPSGSPAACSQSRATATERNAKSICRWRFRLARRSTSMSPPATSRRVRSTCGRPTCGAARATSASISSATSSGSGRIRARATSTLLPQTRGLSTRGRNRATSRPMLAATRNGAHGVRKRRRHRAEGRIRDRCENSLRHAEHRRDCAQRSRPEVDRRSDDVGQRQHARRLTVTGHTPSRGGAARATSDRGLLLVVSPANLCTHAVSTLPV